MTSGTRKRRSVKRLATVSVSARPLRDSGKRRRRHGRIRRGFLVESMAIALLAWLGFQLLLPLANFQRSQVEDPAIVPLPGGNLVMTEANEAWASSGTANAITSDDLLQPSTGASTANFPVIQRVQYQSDLYATQSPDLQDGMGSAHVSGWHELRVRLP